MVSRTLVAWQTYSSRKGTQNARLSSTKLSTKLTEVGSGKKRKLTHDLKVFFLLLSVKSKVLMTFIRGHKMTN